MGCSRSYSRSHEETGTEKTPGYSLIEVRKQLYVFFTGEDSHPNSEEINQILENLKSELKASGYIPDTSCVLRDIDEAMKIKSLWRHNEREFSSFDNGAQVIGQ
ncbi:hypothetical protein like AT3G02010 [Hibiscus trionum]|uniref:Uncharacterized protein n=1 Tax=Hibiscus trionum TaxID=183268 RepID=A0A9W7JAS4_HIBTR|nr:hypothetical protein like AT3G02010 [Hibiscus trionum]